MLIGGSLYAGETKKSVFSFLNYIMPERGVMPMHCSANVDDNGESAVFFGLHRPDLAFAEIVVLWLSIVATIMLFHPLDATAATLLLPYAAWVAFARVSLLPVKTGFGGLPQGAQVVRSHTLR